MNPAAAMSRRVVIVAMMLLCASAVIAVPAFSTWTEAAGSDSVSSAVPVESDIVVIVAELEEDSSVEEVAAEYAKIQTEKSFLESEDKRVIVEDARPLEGDGRAVADLFKQAMGIPAGCSDPFQGQGPDGGAHHGPEQRPAPAGPMPPEADPEPDAEDATVYVGSSGIDARPDAQIVRKVVEMIDGSGDENLKSISASLQQYLAWIALWGGDDSTAAVLSAERKDDAEDDGQQDSEPYIVEDAEEQEPPEADPEPYPEPAFRDAPSETSSFYYTGVTTSGPSF